MNKIYFIKLVEDDSFTYYNSESDKNHPVYEELFECMDVDDNKYLGFTDSDDIFIRLSEYKINKITEVLKKYFIFTKTDVTNDVIRGEIQTLFPEVEEFTPNLFDNFRLDNTTIDDVLDKINELGINSLDDIDMIILKNPSS
jgi:hypothetical protein